MRVLIKPGPLNGELAAQPAKAEAHRWLICAALADTPTLICPAPVGEDTAATGDCLRQLGASLKTQDGGLLVRPLGKDVCSPLLDCRESGASLRFLLPLSTVLAQDAAFRGAGRLPKRPLGDLISALREHGISFSGEKLPFSVRGRLRGGLFCLPGHISSQYISGLLLALPLAKEDSEIRLATPLQSPGYVKMTLAALKDFDIEIKQEKENFYIAGRQSYKSPGRIDIKGDWSGAAFFLAAGALFGPVGIHGLDPCSLQPDKEILRLLAAFGALVKQREDTVTVSRGSLIGQEIDIAATADLAPLLAVLGALARGRTVLKNAARLRHKESDRLKSISALLSSLGALVTENEDSLVIQGQEHLNGGEVRAFGDHRVVMAAALAACGCRRDIIIRGAEAIDKSYPGFFADIRSLGGYAKTVQKA
ncbi:MAG: 3-phosphoshikimate 1-carboxyvinyltransferase [Clostridiales bacterium]|nr:3-phosphoshikimate 1-carboxyvinyltransferase [Clostridiales bacterium]